MRHTLTRDDMPLLSQWIKKSTSRSLSIFWRREGDFPSLSRLSPRFARCRPRRKQSTGLFSSARLRLAPSAVRIPSINKKDHPSVVFFIWRREGDSNPRTGLTVTRFPIVRLRPAQPPLRTHYLKRLIIIHNSLSSVKRKY